MRSTVVVTQPLALEFSSTATIDHGPLTMPCCSLSLSSLAGPASARAGADPEAPLRNRGAFAGAIDRKLDDLRHLKGFPVAVTFLW